jgi:hypothetical protein
MCERFSTSSRSLLWLASEPSMPRSWLGRWVHMLGFRGHFATKSRRYSITLRALRRARRRAQALIAEPKASGRPLDLAALEAGHRPGGHASTDCNEPVLARGVHGKALPRLTVGVLRVGRARAAHRVQHGHWHPCTERSGRARRDPPLRRGRFRVVPRDRLRPGPATRGRAPRRRMDRAAMVRAA